MAEKVEKNKPSNKQQEPEGNIDKKKGTDDKELKGADSENDKKKKKSKDKPKKEKKGIGGKIFPLFILLLIIVSLAGILYYNVFDIREKYLRETLDKVPIVRDLLPASEVTEQDSYARLSRDELIAQINALERQLNTEIQKTDDLNKKIDLYVDEISNLKVFQDQQLEFKEEKAEFDRMIAEGNPEAYANFYASIYPENAEELYKSAAVVAEHSGEVKKYINMVAAMDEKSAAKMLEELLVTDMSIVVNIMKGLSTEQSGSILSSMTKEHSASVTKQMSPY